MKHVKVDIIFWQFDGGYCGDDTLTINSEMGFKKHMFLNYTEYKGWEGTFSITFKNVSCSDNLR